MGITELHLMPARKFIEIACSSPSVPGILRFVGKRGFLRLGEAATRWGLSQLGRLWDLPASVR